MGRSETDWIEAAGHRLHTDLRRELLALFRLPDNAAVLPVGALVRRWREQARRLQVLVELDEDDDVSEAGRALAACGCRQVRPLRVVGAVAAEATPAAIRRLLATTRARRVRLDRTVQALLDVAAPTVRAPAVWSLGVEGSGVAVAVVDTGIAPHPDFRRPFDRLSAFHDVVAGRSDFYDDNGHGTHVAGIVAGSGALSLGRYRGLAPRAKLVGVKVLNAAGSGRTSDVLAGLDWLLRRSGELGVRVVNISLGAPAVDLPDDDPLARAAAALWRHGLVVCVAAGNAGPAPGTVATPGTCPEVITVGASDDHGTRERADDTMADFSSRGPTPAGLKKPDVVAPGVHITAANAPGSRIARERGRADAPYITLSGTSMATPVVAGLAALILSARPNLRPDDVKALLTGTSTPLGTDANAEGSGLVDALALLRAAAGNGRRTWGPAETPR